LLRFNAASALGHYAIMILVMSRIRTGVSGGPPPFLFPIAYLAKLIYRCFAGAWMNGDHSAVPFIIYSSYPF